MKKYSLSLLILSGSILFITCEKLDIKPATKVATLQATPSYTSIAVVGAIYDLSNGDHGDFGFCYGASPNPLATGSVISLGPADKGEFSDTLTGLEEETNYYIRAYCKDGGDFKYGQELAITTLTTTPPVLTTVEPYNITDSTAVSGGTITSDGGRLVTARGVCWSTTQNPTISGSHTSEGAGLGIFVSYLSGLIANSTYYVRAYATNSKGTAYGEEFFFDAINLPMVTTTAISNITYNSATSGGNVTNTGSGAVTLKGVCWSTTEHPTLVNSTQDGTGLGIFSSELTGLSQATKYYVRAYAISNVGTAFGNEISFTTDEDVSLPTVTTAAISSFTDNSAVGGGVVTVQGGSTVTDRGVCWSTSENPILSNSYVSNGSGLGAFTSNLTGLSATTTYYVRAYATNTAGTAYGNQVNFTTSSITNTVTDYDGNIYDIITIGTQKWMGSNLKTTHYRDGSDIPYISDGGQWSGLSTGAYCYYENNTTNADTYGFLYNYFTTIDSRNLCPSGWYVPSDIEWKTLEIYLGMTVAQADATSWRGTDQGGKLKEEGTAHWISTNTGTTNSSGFTALPGGNRSYNSTFNNIGSQGYWWTSTEFNTDYPWYRSLIYNTTQVARDYDNKLDGLSVRCLKDEGTSIVIPTVTTSAISSITSSTATGGGNVTSDGNGTISARGVCWSTTQLPTISNDRTTDDGTTGSFISSLTGLTASTTYYVRAYATNSAGTAYGNQEDFITNGGGSFTCGNTLSVQHTAGEFAPFTKNVNYGTVETNLTGSNKCWITQNLGANSQASSYSDADVSARGWFWQFNQKQGREHDGTNLTPAWTITSINENSDWLPVNDPCASLLGSGWRIPTYTEWENAISNGAWTGSETAYNSDLKLHAAGYLKTDGSIVYIGVNGDYWSSTQVNNVNAWGFGFYITMIDVYNSDTKAYGFNLRCLKD